MEILTVPLEGQSPPGELMAAEVREQLGRMLASHLFRQSRRFAPLLRFIVEESLAGRGEALKERLLGVHVFHREPSYDTAADPIVRVTVAEVRKRIALYYHDEAHAHELRIELPPGHYVAEFRPGKPVRNSEMPESVTLPEPQRLENVSVVPDPELSGAHFPAEPFPHPSTELHAPTMFLHSRFRQWLAGLGIALLLGATVGVVAILVLRPQTAKQDGFWTAWLPPGKPILLCLPTDVGRHPGALTQAASLLPVDSNRSQPSLASAKVTFLEHETAGENVVFSDAVAGMRVVDALARHAQNFHVRLNNSVTLDDLRQGPAVLIGGLDNQWSLQAIAPLRYKFAGSDELGYWISDTEDRNNRRWFLNLKQEYASVTRDYALIAFVHSPEAGQPQLVIAGIGMSGTMAAGEFVSDPARMEQLGKRLGSNLNDRDFEVVLGTDVIHGISGAPEVLATWIR